MRILLTKLAGYLMAGALVLGTLTVPVAAGANPYGYMTESSEPTGSEMMADAFLMRPFMLVSTVVTTATFVVTLPFSLLGGNVGDAAEQLVVEPARYTFTRPLGDL